MIKIKKYIEEMSIVQGKGGGLALVVKSERPLIQAVGVTKWDALRNFVLKVRYLVQDGQLKPLLADRPLVMRKAA